MSFTPLRSHSGTPGFTIPTIPSRSTTTFKFRLDDENAPPDPTMGADAIIPGGGAGGAGNIFAISRQNSLAPSASATPRPSTPVITSPFSPSPLRSSLIRPSTTVSSVPGSVAAGKIRLRVDPNMLSTFDPKDNELYELWAGRLP